MLEPGYRLAVKPKGLPGLTVTIDTPPIVRLINRGKDIANLRSGRYETA